MLFESQNLRVPYVECNTKFAFLVVHVNVFYLYLLKRKSKYIPPQIRNCFDLQ